MRALLLLLALTDPADAEPPTAPNLGLAQAGQATSSSESRPAAAMTGPDRPEDGLVTVGAPTVIGRLKVEGVEEVLGSYASQLRYCYQRVRLNDPTLAGSLRVGFTVGRGGVVSQVSISDSILADPAVEGCLVGRFERMRFDAPRGRTEATVVVPLTFTPP